MNYRFPDGSIIIGVAVIALGLYRLWTGKYSHGGFSGDFHDDDAVIWIEGAKARILAALIVASGCAALFDVFLFLAFVVLTNFIAGMFSRNI